MNEQSKEVPIQGHMELTTEGKKRDSSCERNLEKKVPKLNVAFSL